MRKNRTDSYLRSLRNQPMSMRRYAKRIESDTALDFYDRWIYGSCYDVSVIKGKHASLRLIDELIEPTRRLGI